jgi:hypothetical protein
MGIISAAEQRPGCDMIPSRIDRQRRSVYLEKPAAVVAAKIKLQQPLAPPCSLL